MSYQTSSKRSPPFWLLIGARKLLCFSAQSEGRTAATVWNWSGKTLSPGALLAVVYFFRAIFFRPFRLALAPTICPWVSEDVSVKDWTFEKEIQRCNSRSWIQNLSSSVHVKGITVAYFFVISTKHECLSQQQKWATKLGKKSFNKIGIRNAVIRPPYNEQQDVVLSALTLLLPSRILFLLTTLISKTRARIPNAKLSCRLNPLFLFPLIPLVMLVVCGVSLGKTCV